MFTVVEYFFAKCCEVISTFNYELVCIFCSFVCMYYSINIASIPNIVVNCVSLFQVQSLTVYFCVCMYSVCITLDCLVIEY